MCISAQRMFIEQLVIAVYNNVKQRKANYMVLGNNLE